ncbi:TRAP transporter small permease [Thauera phenolivorans]|uniref:TRAP transporter small permease n=1 Tax=Thauera phenolivorans TaxID=1792543 RepID=UPI00083B6153|nr:TRAP transporter small permease [Thauera phenolivorans]
MLKKIDDNLEEFILVILMFAMTALIAVQIFMRYVMQDSLTWSEELARYLFVWVSYIGVSYAVKRSAHIRVEAATMFLPERVKRYVILLSHLAFLVFAVMVVKEGYTLSMKIFKFGQTSPALGIPMGYIYLAPTVGFLLTFFRLLQNIVASIKELKSGVA